jgi:tRNA pseudouridine55 synthase
MISAASAVSGFLALAKPAGTSSAAAVTAVRRLTGIRKAGHAGTLDPAAEGLLVLAFNRATLLFPYLSKEKTYRAFARLGVTTDTWDAQGEVRETRPVPALTLAEITAAAERFEGVQPQVPPVYSALHHQGQRLYRLARAGRAVTPLARTVTIHEVRVAGWTPPDLILDIRCLAGTYIRSLVHDLGEVLGCGAHLARLVRTACSGFDLAQAVTLDDLTELCRRGRWQERIVSPEQALPELPAWTASDEQRVLIGHGRVVELPAGQEYPGLVKVLDRAGELIAVARIEDRRLRVQRLVKVD